MADLFNQQISATYSGLLKTTSNGILSSSLAQITDGRGNGSQLYLSTSKINFYNAYEFPTSDGSANQVLKTDGSGVLTWEDDANTGGVQVSGTPTTNQIAIWTNATTIKGMSALEIDTNDKITLTQGTNNYYLGGGNLANNSGEGNVGLGNDVFRVQTSGNFNIGIGNFAFYDFITGVRNIGIGYNSFSNTIGCSSNVGVGASTLAYSTGDNNTALGDSALGNSSFTGANNTAIGFDSGKSITTGSNNVILGSNTGSTIATSSNNIIISDGSGNNRIQVDSGGDVGIGITPSTIWSTSYNALQIGLGGSIYAHKSAGSSMRMAANVVYEGTAPSYYDKYLTTSTASKYEQDSGNHVWSTAASGTINTAIPWSERMRIDGTTGNVGIGITPTSKLTLLGTSTAASNTPSDAIVDIRGTSTAHLLMGVANVSPYGAWINTDSTTQPLILMGTGGNVGIGSTGVYTTNAILNLQGSGIALKNDKNGNNDNWSYIENTGTASLSDINFYTGNNASALNLSHSGLATFSNGIKFGTGDTLDAYEEGSWNPIFENATATYTQQDGHYTKIGNKVYFILRLITSAITQSASRVSITLPITSATNYSPVTCFAEKGFNPSGGAGNIVPLVIQNQAYMDFWVIASSTGFNYTDLTYNDLSDDMIIRVSGFYEV